MGRQTIEEEVMTRHYFNQSSDGEKYSELGVGTEDGFAVFRINYQKPVKLNPKQIRNLIKLIKPSSSKSRPWEDR